MNLLLTTQTIPTVWAADTSSTPDLWTPENPALGQCAVTALVLQDYYGGDLLRVTNRGEGHYFNCIVDPITGAPTRIDLTWSQFSQESWEPEDDEQVRDRAYVLSFPDTVRRYELLRDRVAAALNGATA